MWRAGAVVEFTYNGLWVMQNGTIADKTYYGVTRLSSDTNSNSEDFAATPKSVKAAYDKGAEALTAANEAKSVRTLGNVTATVDSTTGTPTVTTTATPTDNGTDITFAFAHLKGDTGQPGMTTTVAATGTFGTYLNSPCWICTNRGIISSTATLKLTLKTAGVVSFSYGYGSEANTINLLLWLVQRQSLTPPPVNRPEVVTHPKAV